MVGQVNAHREGRRRSQDARRPKVWIKVWMGGCPVLPVLQTLPVLLMCTGALSGPLSLRTFSMVCGMLCSLRLIEGSNVDGVPPS